MAATARFSRRLGPQFAAAITYFSVLSLVPVIMFGVSLLGMTLTVLRPDWLDMVRDLITQELGETSISKSIIGVIDEALFRWRSIGVASLLTAGYSGSKWIGNLKKAFRVMWLEKFSDASATKGFVRELVENLLIFLGLLGSFMIAFVVTSAGGAFSEQVIYWFGLQHIPGIGWLFRLVSIVLVLLASWLLFAFLFIVLPGRTTSVRNWFIGTIMGAVLVTALQQAAGLLIGVFRGNTAASAFGPIIVLMLMLNLLATIILMVSAWVGTAETWPEWLERQKQEREDPSTKQERRDEIDLDEDDDTEPHPVAPGLGAIADDPRSWAEKRRRERWAARMTPDELRAIAQAPEAALETGDAPPVPQDVAARSVRVGMGIGWGVGAATGIGLGAAIAAVVAAITRR